MNFNSIFQDFKCHNGNFKMEDKFQQILSEMKLKTISCLFTFQNGVKEEMIIDPTNPIRNLQARNYYEELNIAMFGNYVINYDSHASSNSAEKIKNRYKPELLITGNPTINNFLSGGFTQGKIYELQGQSLTGKSYFLNALLESNSPKKKILLIDTNSSFCLENLIAPKQHTKIQSKVDHIDHICDFKELSLYFQSLFTKGDFKAYSFIFIDSLSLIANKFSLNKDELIKEFNNLVLSIVAKFNVGVIYTSTCRLKDKVMYDFVDLNIKTPLAKEMESNLHNNLIMLPDYTLFFIGGSYSFSLNGFKNRKYFIRIKQEKYHAIDILVEL